MNAQHEIYAEVKQVGRWNYAVHVHDDFSVFRKGGYFTRVGANRAAVRGIAKRLRLRGYELDVRRVDAGRN
jgi:hypothetical protein